MHDIVVHWWSFVQRKEKLLKKQHREALLLDNMMGVNGLAPGHSLRGRKRVSYTFGMTPFAGFLILSEFHHKLLVFSVSMWVMVGVNYSVSTRTYLYSQVITLSCIFLYLYMLDCISAL